MSRDLASVQDPLTRLRDCPAPKAGLPGLFLKSRQPLRQLSAERNGWVAPFGGLPVLPVDPGETPRQRTAGTTRTARTSKTRRTRPCSSCSPLILSRGFLALCSQEGLAARRRRGAAVDARRHRAARAPWIPASSPLTSWRSVSRFRFSFRIFIFFIASSWPMAYSAECTSRKAPGRKFMKEIRQDKSTFILLAPARGAFAKRPQTSTRTKLTRDCSGAL